MTTKNSAGQLGAAASKARVQDEPESHGMSRKLSGTTGHGGTGSITLQGSDQQGWEYRKFHKLHVLIPKAVLKTLKRHTKQT